MGVARSRSYNLHKLFIGCVLFLQWLLKYKALLVGRELVTQRTSSALVHVFHLSLSLFLCVCICVSMICKAFIATMVLCTRFQDSSVSVGDW